MPVKVNIHNQNGEVTGEASLNAKVFAVKPNSSLVHQAYVTQMANERQVLAHTKDRSEVRGGGKKPWRQKGTGRARAGSSRSPIWIGGGVTFGPTKDRNFKKQINRKMKQKAICMVLSDKAVQHQLAVLDGLVVNEYKTKAVGGILKNIEQGSFSPKAKVVSADNKEKAKKPKKEPSAPVKPASKRSILLINDNKSETAKYSARNLAGVKMINIENVNIVDLLTYRNVVITRGAVSILEERYGA